MTTMLLAVLAIWFLLSAANQIPRARGALLTRLSSFGLLPNMWFFAPNPLDVDHHFVIRDILADGTETAWRQVPIGAKETLRAVWGAAERDRWALISAVKGVAVVGMHLAPRFRDADSIVSISLPFLYLLNLAMAEERAPGAVSRQFMIVESSGFGPDRQITLGILSDHYAFGDRDAAP